MPCVTAEMQLAYRRPVPMAEEVVVRARLVEVDRHDPGVRVHRPHEVCVQDAGEVEVRSEPPKDFQAAVHQLQRWRAR